MRAVPFIWTLLAVLVLAVVGCSYDKGVASSPGDYGGDGTYAVEEAERYARDEAQTYGGGEYDFADDVVDGEALAPEGASMSSRARSKQSSLIDRRESFDAPKDAPNPELDNDADTKPKPRASTATRRGGQGEASAPPPSTRRRQVIYTASMQISVYRVDEAVDYAEVLPAQLGGWIQERANNLIILRVPAAELDRAMELLAEQGVVEERTLQAYDVTDQYTDLDSRIRILAETKAQLDKLLAQAKTVEQALEVRKALDAVTMELELAQARMRELASAIAFSTLVVRFSARGPAEDLPSSNDPFPWVTNLGVETTEYR